MRRWLTCLPVALLATLLAGCGNDAPRETSDGFARGGSRESDPERDLAGVTATPFRAWLDDWTLVSRVGDSGRERPTRWRLRVPDQDLDLVVAASHTDRWMATTVSYWEGEVKVADHASGAPRGRGYLEMTGC